MGVKIKKNSISLRALCFCFALLSFTDMTKTRINFLNTHGAQEGYVCTILLIYSNSI
jgi:hypothetical protein